MKLGWRRRRAGVALLSLVVSMLAAQPALATFHEIVIREVYPGSAAQPDSEYVELQMWSAGQNFVAGHPVDVFDAAGTAVGGATFSHDVSGGASQSTLLVATPAAEAEFGIVADAGLAPGLLSPAGGAVCWESLDCISWGGFAASPRSPSGQPAYPGGIPDGMALRRSIAAGCATLLEPGDDRDSSATDFTAVFPAPRPNSVSPSEHACSPQGGGSAGGGSAGTTSKPPQTSIRRRPGRLTRDRTPTFGFASSVPGSTYLCKLDARRFGACSSPFTAPRLGYGAHVFKVRARAGGEADPSPATWRFSVQPKRPQRH